LVAKALFDEPNIASESRWAKGRKLTVAALIDEPWVLVQPASLARSLHVKGSVTTASSRRSEGADDVAPSLHA
jgi:hypothetical protein